jgi:parvulin-like peptidyl-prolyl isomerase
MLVAGLALGALIMRERYKRLAQEVIVSVNGANITKDQFYSRLEKAAGAQVIRAMVGEELVLQYARQNNMLPTEQQVEARLAEEKKKPNYKETLARTRLTESDLKRAFRISLAQAAVLNQGVTVTDPEIRRFYERNVDKKNPNARYYTPETIQIAVIVTRTEEEAKKARQQLRLKSWAAVVKEFSVDMSKANNGLLPPTLRGRTRASKIAGLEDDLFRMKVGEQMGPRRFAGAWWIIRCVDRKPEKTLPFEQVKDECRTGAMLLKGIPANAKKVQEGFEEFQKKANIQAFWTQYKQAVSAQ